MKEYKASNETYIIRDPQTKQIIKQGEYRIKQPETQNDYFLIEEDLIPDIKVDDKKTYAPLRNVHIYGVNNHKEN